MSEPHWKMYQLAGLIKLYVIKRAGYFKIKYCTVYNQLLLEVNICYGDLLSLFIITRS